MQDGPPVKDVYINAEGMMQVAGEKQGGNYGGKEYHNPTEFHILATIKYDGGIPLISKIKPDELLRGQKDRVGYICHYPGMTAEQKRPSYVVPPPWHVHHVKDDKYVITIDNHGSFEDVALGIAQFLVGLQGRSELEYEPNYLDFSRAVLHLSYNDDEDLERRIMMI